MYWKDHDGSSYLVTAQNVGAYSSQALDDGNIAFVYAVHLGTEWHLNYRVFDPSSKSFLTEEDTIASNVYAEAIGGQYISVNITALGSGGFSAVLETGAPDHTVLKYSEVSNTSSGYNSSEGSNVRPSLEQVGDTTGSTDLYWKDHDGSSYLVTAQNVGAYSSQALDDGNIAFVYAVHLGTEWHLNYRVFDPSSKSFLTEETTIASNVYAEAGGQYISVNITALGSGGFSAVLETGAPDHTVLKYVKVNRSYFLI